MSYIVESVYMLVFLSRPGIRFSNVCVKNAGMLLICRVIVKWPMINNTWDPRELRWKTTVTGGGGLWVKTDTSPVH